MGYFNIDIIDLDIKGEEYFYMLLQNGYQSLINTATHMSRSNGTCIDHILLKGNYQAIAGKLIDPITDHDPVMQVFHNNKCAQKVWFEINKKKFIALCEKEKWNKIHNTNNNEETLEELIKKDRR